MYESEHSGALPREDIRRALLRLKDALAQHEAALPPVSLAAESEMLQVLRCSVALMRQEADRLRGLLAED